MVWTRPGAIPQIPNTPSFAPSCLKLTLTCPRPVRAPVAPQGRRVEATLFPSSGACSAVVSTPSAAGTSPSQCGTSRIEHSSRGPRSPSRPHNPGAPRAHFEGTPARHSPLAAAPRKNPPGQKRRAGEHACCSATGSMCSRRGASACAPPSPFAKLHCSEPSLAPPRPALCPHRARAGPGGGIPDEA